MHVASSASINHVQGVLESCGLTPFFQHAIGWDVVRAPKKARHGLYFTRMLARTGIRRGETSFFIGDSVEEGLLASAKNMRYVLVDREGDGALRERAHMHGYPVVDGLDGVAKMLT